MGVSIYIRLDRSISGYKPELEMDGKTLAKEFDDLNKLCEQNGLPLLSSMVSFNPEEVSGFMEGEGLDLEELEIPKEQFFDSQLGLIAVDGLLKLMNHRNSKLNDIENLIEDLNDCKKILTYAVGKESNFYFTYETP